MKKATDAALIGNLGDVLGIVATAQPAGSCRYYYQTTIDGSPVNTRLGRLSRSARNLDRARRNPDPCDCRLTASADSFRPE
jgi:hypothetical protein